MRGKAEKIEHIVDMHCHVLPHVDDGANTMDEALEMISIAEQEGITHMIVTPHFKNHRKRVTGKQLLDSFEKLKGQVSQRSNKVRLYLGNEVFYFGEMEQAIENGEIFSMNSSNYLLVEFSPQDTFSYIRNGLDDVAGLGYTPILAHAERYECMVKHFEYAKELHTLGIKIQINAASVMGELGFGVKKYTKKLLKNQLVDYIATDAHSSRSRAPRIKKCMEVVSRKYGTEYAGCVFGENAIEDMNLSV